MSIETEVIVMPIILAAILFAPIAYENSRPKVCTKIVSIGGCSEKGLCGMRLKDGRIGKMYYPVVGGEFCEPQNRTGKGAGV